MGRPQKEGIEYFSLDVDFFADRKIKVLKGRFGAEGITYYLYLLCEIYREHGYYLECDEDLDYVSSSELGIDPKKIAQMRTFLLERSLFDSALFQSEHILTSAGVQRRYQLAVKARAAKTPVTVQQRYWLLSPQETQSFIQVQPCADSSEKKDDISEKNPSQSGKNDTKKRKEKEKEKVVVDVAREKERLCCCFAQNIAPVTAAVEREIGVYLEQKGLCEGLMRRAIEHASLSGGKSWRYVAAILDGCLCEGIATPEEFDRQNQKPKPSARVRPARAAQPAQPGSSSIDFDAIERYLNREQ